MIALFVVTQAPVKAQTLCAKAQLQLDQQIAIERQGFVATMTVNDGLPVDLDSVAVNINFTDAQGNPVTATSDPTNTTASFYIALQSVTPNVTPLAVPSTVPTGTTTTLSWLIIPTVGAGGNSASGAVYQVGAILTYTEAGQQESMAVTPATITVQPLPALRLDYFIPQYVYGDNPLTPQIEPSTPFNLGLRVENNGAGPCNNLQIQSSQPVITSNVQGLNVAFKILGCQVNGQTATPSLLANLGNVGPGQTAVADWVMTSSLTGNFSNFSATLSHSASLGGALTSLIQTQNVYTHILLQNVLVDTQGGDNILDFLAYTPTTTSTNGTVTPTPTPTPNPATPTPIYVYGSGGTDQLVTDVSTSTTVSTQNNSLTITPSVVGSGFIYSTGSDPKGGTMSIKSVIRSDGKLVNTNNAWLYSTFNKVTQQFDYFWGLFDDTNSTGLSYTLTYGPANTPQGPTFQNIPNQIVSVGTPYVLVVKATDADGTIPSLSVSNLPVGPTFVDNGNGTGTLTWNSTAAQDGQYIVQFTASETTSTGILTAQATPQFSVTSTGAIYTWISQYFPGVTDPTVVGDLANPEKDGLSNLVKYALELDPTKPIANSGVAIGMNLVNGKHYLTLTYTHRTDDPTLSFSVVASPVASAPLSQWTAQTTSIPVSQNGVPAGMEMDEIQDSVAAEDGTPRRYLKLQVTLTGN